jgi:TATA-binding protein-associated factor Taf7
VLPPDLTGAALREREREREGRSERRQKERERETDKEGERERQRERGREEERERAREKEAIRTKSTFVARHGQSSSPMASPWTSPGAERERKKER